MRHPALGLCVLAVGLVAASHRAAAESIIRFSPAVPAGGVQAQAVAPEVVTPVALAAKTRERADFISQADWCWAAPSVMEDGGTYTRLDLPGLAAGGEIGEPRIPYHGKFIRVPDGAQVRLVVDDVTWEEIPGAYTVDPEQPPQSLALGEPRPPFTKSAVSYARDTWVPEAPVRLADRMRIRGREFVYVVYAPVAYNPARSALRAASRVAWHLEYELPAGGSPAPRPDPVGEEAFTGVFALALDGTVPEAFAAAPAPLGSNGADYLILAPAAFMPQLQSLAQLKTQMGLIPRLVSLESIGGEPTASNITAYIRNAYETWRPRPTYVALVGDVAELPAHDETADPSRPGMPATDLYYATVDGDDIFPDLAVGRLSCSSTAECGVVVDKIVNHQIAPNPDADYRNGTLVTGWFQDKRVDGTGKVCDPADGIEASLFFIEGAETLKDYREARGGVVYTAYNSETDIRPQHYAGASIMHEGNTPYLGTQTYVSDAQAAADTKNWMNRGLGLVSYYSHGGWNGWDRMFNSDVANMTNGTRLPVVISITCQTGWLDWQGEDCFLEFLQKQRGGGGVAMIGCTRNAYSFGTDWIRAGIFDCFWPDFLSTLSSFAGYRANLAYGGNYVGRSPRMGPALNYGKMCRYDKLNEGSQQKARYDFEIYILFGDPHMHFQPWNDTRLRATHPVAVTAEHAQFTVTVTDTLGTPKAGAAVRIFSAAGDDTTRTTDANGRADFELWPLATDYLSVEATAPGMVPYAGRIDLHVSALTVQHPATASAVAAGFVVRVYQNGTVPLASALVVASSDAGDNRVRTTDAAGEAVFTFIPSSITTLDITVSKRAFATYHGVIQLVPGTFTVTHDAEIDEGRGPFDVTVRRDGIHPMGATVKVTGAGGVVGELTTDVNGVARFPTVPLGADTLTIDVTAQGYTPVRTTARVVPGTFVWDALPPTLEIGDPHSVAVSLVSSLDGLSRITGYQGSPALTALGNLTPPPPVAIIDIRRYAEHSFVILQNVRESGSVSLQGWMLVKNGSTENVNTVDPDIKDPGVSLNALATARYRTANYTTVGAPDHWQAVDDWQAQSPGWVMLLDAETNIVDFLAWGWQAEELASMAPVVRGRAVPLGSQWNGDGVPSGSTLKMVSRNRVDNPQDRNVPDDFRAYESGFEEPFDTAFVAFGSPLAVAPATIGPFVNGAWAGPVSVLELGSGVSFVAEDEAHTGVSEAFDVVPTPHVGYALALPGNGIFLRDAAFEVTIEARDSNAEPYVGFEGLVDLYAFENAVAAPVLITECGISSYPRNFLEIQNVSGVAQSTAGWKLLAGDKPTNLNGYNAAVKMLPDTMAAGQVLAWSDASQPPETYWGADLQWSQTNAGWVMLLDDANVVVDFVAWGWDDAALDACTPVYGGRPRRVGTQWTGPGATLPRPTYRGASGSLQRLGAVDRNDARNFVWKPLTSRSQPNAGLTVPLTAGRRTVRMSPAQSGTFGSGVWTGDVKVHQEGTNLYLEAIDAAGLSGLSSPFRVMYYGPLTVIASASMREDDVQMGHVLREGMTGSVTVQLTSSDPTRLQVTPSVTIAHNSDFESFVLTAVDTVAFDFAQQVEITARADGYSSGSASVSVLDNNFCYVAVTISPTAFAEGAGVFANAGRVDVPWAPGQDTVFNLVSSKPSLVSVPATVTIPEGANWVPFDVTVLDDAEAAGSQTVQITATPDDYWVGTGTVQVADNDAFAFAFAPLPVAVTAAVPFTVAIEAIDPLGARVPAYRGTAALSATNPAGVVSLSRSETGPFVGGAWTGELAALDLARGVRLVARDDVYEGASGLFDVTHGALARFAWTLPATDKLHAGAWLPVQVQALDTNGYPVQAFAGPARLRATRHDLDHPVRVLTFVGYANMDAAHRPARAALDAYFPHVAETLTSATNAVELAALLATHDVFLLVAQEYAPAGRMAELGTAWRTQLQAFVLPGGVVIGCSGGADEHVLLRQAQLANLMLESLGGGMSATPELRAAVTNRLTSGLPERFFSTDAVGFSAPDCQPVVRSVTNGVPAVMQRRLARGQVVMIGTDFAEDVPEFGRILANAVRLGLKRVPEVVPAAPASAPGFVGGVWTGVVQVTAEALDACLLADDYLGHEGASAFFDLEPLSLRGFRTVAGGSMVIEWDSAGVTPYVIDRASGGMDRGFLPWASNLLASPPMNTYTGQMGTASPQFYRVRVPVR